MSTDTRCWRLALGLAAVWTLAVAAEAASLYWDAGTNAAPVAGSGIWSTGDNYWGTNTTLTVGHTRIPWVNGYDAVFTVAATAQVNGVSANSIVPSGTYLVPGTGPLTLGAGGMALGSGQIFITCPIVLGADQMWSINNSTGQRIDGPISGPGRLTARMSGVYNGSLTITNMNNAFNGFATYGAGGSMGSYGGLTVAAGTITNGLILGMPGGSATNGASLTITNFATATSFVGDLTVASPAYLKLSVLAGTTNTFLAGNVIRLGHATLELTAASAANLVYSFTNGLPMNNGIVSPWLLGVGAIQTYTGGVLSVPAAHGFSVNSATQYVSLGGPATLT